MSVFPASQSVNATTDANGRFLFRELHSGTFHVSAVYRSQTVDRLVAMPEQPVQLTDADLIMGQR